MELLLRNMQMFHQSNLLLQFNILIGSFSIRASWFYILTSWQNILLGCFYIFLFVNHIGTIVNYILAFVNYIFVFETSILAYVNYILPSESYILASLFIKLIRKPTATGIAHLHTASPTPKPMSAKELFPSFFSPPPKKNKFPSPTPAYLQTNWIKSTAYNN